MRWWGALTCLDLVAKPSPAPEARAGACVCSAASAHPVAACATIAGRGGARGGGADRVGPPTGWHRLRQIGDELVAGVEQFLLVDNIVAVEDGAALVSGQEHGDPLGHAGTNQVTGGGAAAVMKEAGRHPGGLAGGAPRRAPAADRDPVAVEDERVRN